MDDGRFSFVSDKEVAESRENRVPSNTKRHTLWSTSVYIPMGIRFPVTAELYTSLFFILLLSVPLSKWS